MRLHRSTVVTAAILAFMATGCSEGGSTSDEDALPVNPRESSAALPAPEPAEGGGPTQFRPVLASGDEDPAAAAGVGSEMADEFVSFECPDEVDQPKAAAPAVACDAQGTKFLLGPAISGVAVDRAFPYEFADVLSVGIVLTPGSSPRLTRAVEGVEASSVALELGGVVIAHGSVSEIAGRGRTEVTGEFDQETAQALADRIMSATSR